MNLYPIPKPKCKICDSQTYVYGVADFNKSCNDTSELDYIGYPIHYFKCLNCGLIFTDEFNLWTHEDFANHIYNDDYIKVDPEYVDVRPNFTATWLSPMLDKSLSVLDYGSGNGKTAKLLVQQGFNVKTWDEYSNPNDKPNELFDIIVAIEVLEHTTYPFTTLDTIVQYMKPNSKFIFTTMTNDNLKHREMHWYISPRNGHVTIHSKKSLELLFAKYGMVINHNNDNLHTATFKQQ